MTQLTKKELVVELEALRRKTAEQEVTIAALKAQISNITEVASAVNTMHTPDTSWRAEVEERRRQMEATKLAAMTLGAMMKV